MVSPRRAGSRARRSLLRILPVLVTAVLAGTLASSPAGAQPAPDAAGAAAQLETVQREAEALTEEWHAATDAAAARQAELEAMRAAVGPARAAVDAARATEAEYRLQVDAVVLAAFESGRLDQLNALLASTSPQDYLDQMSALESMSREHLAALDGLKTVVEGSRRARAESDTAAARAQLAASAADGAVADLENRRRAAETRIEEAERLLDRLSPQEREDRLGPDEDAPAPATGSGVGVRALDAARTQLGKPYAWGAEGPGSFDCSGLTSWAFERAGVPLPRSSRQQATVGREVPWEQMRPGDLVFYYSPVSHVGIYAGEGKMLDAPQAGDTVGYRTVSRSAFTGARRL